jgi:hypothetical protein
MYTQDLEIVILLGPHCSLVFSKRPRDIAAGFIWIQVAPLVTPPLARSDRPLFPSWSKGADGFDPNKLYRRLSSAFSTLI